MSLSERADTEPEALSLKVSLRVSGRFVVSDLRACYRVRSWVLHFKSEVKPPSKEFKIGQAVRPQSVPFLFGEEGVEG